jgi:hypothetical protein
VVAKEDAVMMARLRELVSMEWMQLKRVLDIPSPSRIFTRPPSELTPIEREVLKAIVEQETTRNAHP